MLTILGNLLINSENKLQHMKDSFASFEQTSDNWVINIRGKYREEAMAFLKSRLKNKLIAFELLNDNEGWSKHAQILMEKAKYNYVLLWNEDHINLAPQETFSDIIKEMADNQVDYMKYTWFQLQKKYFEVLPWRPLTYIEVVYVTPENWKKVSELKTPHISPYLLSTAGIYKKGLLLKLLKEDTNATSYFLRTCLVAFFNFLSLSGKNCNGFYNHVNMYLFKGKLPMRKFGKEYPHNLEKEAHRTDYLPLVFAMPKQELFACIDDDNTIPNCCLIKRGLYSNKWNTHPEKL